MGAITMVCVGDVNVSRPNPDSAFVGTKRWLEADIVFCNLETVVSDTYSPEGSGLPRMPEWMFQSYIDAGFNVVNQANNPHTYQGRLALERSVEFLEERGVAHAGAGRSLAEARAPARIIRGDTSVAFICRTSVGKIDMAATNEISGVSFHPVHTSYEPPEKVHSNPGLPPVVHTAASEGSILAELRSDILAAKEESDIVVVSWHWGLSPYQVRPGAGIGEIDIMEYQRHMAHSAIDFGADLVIGHHSHEPQPIEVYRGRVVCYSLGNFVHDLPVFADRSLTAMVLRCVIEDHRLKRISFVTGTLKGNGPPRIGYPLDTEDEVGRIIKMSAPYGTSFAIGEKDVEVLPGGPGD